MQIVKVQKPVSSLSICSGLYSASQSGVSLAFEAFRKDRYKKTLLFAVVIAAAAQANAVVIFDSGGFETYNTGNLIGQNGYVQDYANTWTVANGVGVGGSKAINVNGGVGGTDWAYTNLAFTPGTGQIVSIKADISRTLGATSPTSSFGYLIDVYSIAGARTIRFGLGNTGGFIRPIVTSRWSAALGFNAAAPISSVLLGTTNYAADEFVNFEALLDYSIKRVDLKINGVSVTGGYTIPFTDLTATTLGDTDLQISTNASATDRGRFDNLKVEAVPEPASMIALGAGALAMLRRRRNVA